MKKYLLILTFCFFQLNMLAQHQQMVDSLKRILPEATKVDKVKVLRDLCYYGSFIDFDEAIEFGKQGAELARQIGFKDGVGQSYGDLGTAYMRAGQMETAQSYLEKALKIFKETGNRKEQAFATNNLGALYKDKADYVAALPYLLEALDIKTEIGGIKLESTLNQIGAVYRFQRQHDKALEYFNKALELARKNKNLSYEADILNNMEIVYRNQKAYDQAMSTRLKCIQIEEQIGDSVGLGVSYNNLGELYYGQEKYLMALKYFKTSLEIKEGRNNPASIAYTLDEIALTYMQLKNYQKAMVNVDKSLEMTRQTQDRKKEMDALLTKSKIFQAMRDYRGALEYYQKHAALKDSLFNESKNLVLADMEAKYQNEKKEAENQVLKAQTDQQTAEINQKNTLMLVFIIGSILLAVLLIFIFRAYQDKNKTSKTLARQKDELTQLNNTKNRFFGIIAHDLRGPLTALQGIAGLISYNIRKNDMDSLKKIAVQIEDSAVKVNELLDNLLKWALSQEGAMPHKPQRLALKALVDESLNYFKDMAEAKGISLDANIPKDIHVHADKESLSTVFRNLVNNGIKFTPEGGSVSLSALEHEAQIQIDVKDSGKGMDESKLEKLFLLDDRKSESGTNAEKGTGLGLVLVHDFVELNRGKISVESEPDKGSVFSITLPTQLAQAG